MQRVVRLGFEVRAELLPADGPQFSVQLTRAEADELELDGRRHRLGARATARGFRPRVVENAPCARLRESRLRPARGR